jgi:hypothetical protein
MTQISEIHGIRRISANEMPDRGRLAAAANAGSGFIPYTSLTRGEMELALYGQQLAIYSHAFPENPDYTKALNMVENAFRSGLSNGVNFVGALHSDYLQFIAKTITNASRQTAPASKGGLLGRSSLASGVPAIGQDIKFNFDHDCVQYATKATNKWARHDKSWQWYENNVNDSAVRRYYREQKSICATKIEIEKIVNEKITNASHHVLYYGLNEGYPAIRNSTVVTKHLLHIGGIGGLANATDTDTSLMSVWSETAILRRNTQADVGPIGSVQSSLNLSPNYDAYAASYTQWQKNRTYTNPKSGKIGEPLTIAAITALIAAIGAAVGQAAAFQKELNAKKAGAMAAAQNYGTVALEAKQTDWNDINTGSGFNNSNLLTFGLLAAGAYLILSDEK